TTEPYRMFTSRAEYRLLLRQDNADLRLSPLGRELGLLPDAAYRRFEAHRRAIEAELERLRNTREGAFTLAQLLKRPEVRYADLPHRNPDLSETAGLQVEVELKYEGYIAREKAEILRFRSLEDKRIPEGLD